MKDLILLIVLGHFLSLKTDNIFTSSCLIKIKTNNPVHTSSPHYAVSLLNGQVRRPTWQAVAPNYGDCPADMLALSDLLLRVADPSYAG